MFRQSTVPRVLTAPLTRNALRIIYYPSALAQWLFFIRYSKNISKSLHGLCSVRLLLGHSTIPRVLTAPFTRTALRIIYYTSTLAQWLLFIRGYKYSPKYLHGLCSVKVLFRHSTIPQVLIAPFTC
jgi:hypothetical protein